MKRIAIALGVLTVLVLAAPAGAELCEKCKGKMYITSVGKCVECGGFTGSGAHKLCKKCSAKLGQCEHCRAPLKGAKRQADKKPTTQPAKTPSYLRALELDASHNGKTVSAAVGQEIIIRLKGNATTGYSWVIGKIEGDALGKVGKVKYVSDDPPRLVPGRGRRLMRHRVGGGGKYVFTFRATKAGTAKLSLEYKRGWEKNKPPAKTFTLNVVIKADPTAERVKTLKAGLDEKDFELVLRYRGPQDKPLYRSLVLSRISADVKAAPGFAHIHISKEQAEKVIDHLADEGFLARAGDNGNVKLSLAGPIYTMEVNCRKMRIYESLGWGLPMLKRLDSLRAVLDGDAAKEMDKLLKRLENKRKEWEKKTPVKKS